MNKDNPEGSRGSHMLELFARKRQKIVITNRQLEILVGCLIGDAYIHPRGQIQIAQSSKQSPYVYWKYRELKNLAYGLPTKIERYDKRYLKSYSQSRFWLRQFFRGWRKIFYPKGKKIFPTEFEKYVTPLSIAVWYMDDGNYSEGRNVKIATDGFSLSDREKIKELLLRKFNLRSTLHKSGKLRISNDSLKDFFRLIRPYIHSSMIYKIP
ncbi:MAG: hypothetical protein ABIJ82_00330 [Patescibacteria group bacterium]